MSEEIIKSFNKELKNWNFKKNSLDEFINFLSERNDYIKNIKKKVDFIPYCKKETVVNKAYIDGTKLNDKNLVAFHLGFPNQKKLYSLNDKHKEAKFNMGVFFSIIPKDVVYFSSNIEKVPYDMVYFANLSEIRDSYIQTNYSSDVISRYDLAGLFTKKKSSPDLKEQLEALNKKWIEKNATSFEVSKIEFFKEKNFDWLIVKDPIEVIYFDD